MRRTTSYILKAATLMFAGWMIFSPKPRIAAQPTSTDAVLATQAERISQLEKHQEDQDRRIQKQWDVSTADGLAINGIQVEERTIGAVIALITGSNLIISVRKKTS